MSSIRRSLPVSLGIVALALAACTTPEPRPVPVPPPPPVRMPPPVIPTPLPETPPAVPPVATPVLTPTTFAALPGWQNDDLRQAWSAFMASCGVLVRKEEWKPACSAARSVTASDAGAVRAYFERWFVPNQVRAADGADTGLVTGYYEAALRGSRKRGGAFQTPLYAVPDDLLTIDLSSVYP
ncbi:MAG: MltA domain-containing protein, partial [Telluria sp.]